MKRIVILVLLIMVCVGISAEIYRINPGQNSVNLITSDQQHTRISFDISNFEYQPVKIGNDTYYQLQLGKEANSYEKGYPEVPQIHRNIIIPNNAKMSVNLSESNFIDIPMAVAPSKGAITRNIDPQTVPYSFSPIYQKAEFYPSTTAELSSPFIMRDFRGITVTASPFIYYPMTKTLRVYTHMVLDIKATGADTMNTLNRSSNEYSKYFEEIYRNLFINFTPDRYTLVNDRGRMIVIAPSSYLTTVQPFVNWKNQKGIKTTLVDVASIGSTAALLKAYIQTQYNLGDGLIFVQLCGDIGQIPSFSVTYGGASGGSDPTYSLLAGSDYYPEIMIGRFSAETTAQLQTQVDRSIQYERDLTTSATWLQTAVGIASDEGGSGGDAGESDAIHMNNIRTQLLSYGYTTVDQTYQSTGPTTATFAANVNTGRGFINYCGHGSDTSWWWNPSDFFANTNVTALTNTNKLPFIFSVACVNGNFTTTTCFAEAWLRATSSSLPTGAVGFYGASINQDWASPMLAEDEFTDLLTAGTKNTLGGLYYNSSCKMMDSYGATSTSSGANMFLTWNIFGEPSLQIRTKTPSTMTVSYPVSIPIGTSSITVSTGITDAKVCLSYAGTILGTGYTASGGNVTLTLTGVPTVPSTLTMTVTAFNKVTHVGSVALVASSPYPAPQTLTATALNKRVILNWAVPYSGTPSSYKVYRGGEVIVSGLTGLTYTNTDLTNGTSYSYYVTAVYTSPSAGESEASNTASATPIASIPTGLAAVAKNGTVNLTWTAPTLETPNGYNVYRNSVKITATPITTTTYSSTGLTNGTSYTFYVTSVFTTPATESASSNTVSATPIAAAPTSLVATVGNTLVSLSWTAPTSETPNGYNVYRNSVKITATPITVLNYSDTSVINSVTYTYYVTSVFNTPTAESASSNTVSATPSNATMVTIGTSSSTSRRPLASYDGYERTANLFTAAEVGTTGNIQTLSWYPTVTTTTAIPVKIYLKLTTSTSLSPAGTWASIISGATTVFNGTITGTTANTWKTIDITDFAYTANNLMIMVECNYGGTGSGTGSSTGGAFKYSTSGSNMVENWFQDSSAPTGSGTLSTNRPNIQMLIGSITPIFSISPTSLTYSSTQINTTSTSQILTVSNTGQGTLTINSTAKIGTDATQFTLTDPNTYPKALTAGQSMSVTVAFAPTSVGAKTASIRFTDTTTHDVALAGIGTAPPQITVNPSSLSASLIPETTGSEQVTLGNSGGVSLSYSITISYSSRSNIKNVVKLLERTMSWLSVSPLSGSIAGNGSTQLSINYNSIGLASGTYDATIVITSNDPVTPTKNIPVHLVVPVVNHTPTITLPASFSFDKNGYLNQDFNDYVADADNNSFSLTFSGNMHIHLDMNALQVTFTADADWIGTESITFTVDDGYRAIASDSVEVTVNPVNIPNWVPVVYPNTQAVIYTSVTIDNAAAEPGDIIAAFVNGECRGSAVLEARRSTSATLLVNVANNGELVSFKLYDLSTDEVFEATNTVTIDIGVTLGAPNNDIPVDIVTIVEAPASVQLHQVVANFTMSWPSVANANTYHVYRSTTPGGDYVEIATVHTNSFNAIDATARMYFYKVTAEKVIAK